MTEKRKRIRGKHIGGPSTRRVANLVNRLRELVEDDVVIAGRGPFPTHIVAACVIAMAEEIPVEVATETLNRALRRYGPEVEAAIAAGHLSPSTAPVPSPRKKVPGKPLSPLSNLTDEKKPKGNHRAGNGAGRS